MELKDFPGKISGFITKYRYVMLILVIGIILMLIPTQVTQKSSEPEAVIPKVTQSNHLHEDLAHILSQINGAGNVKVLLTVAKGEETVYQTNDDISSSEGSLTKQIATVIVTDSDRNESALIRHIIPQIYQGAIVLCEGADSASVKLAIMDAVSKATGLGADNICVLKMN